MTDAFVAVLSVIRASVLKWLGRRLLAYWLLLLVFTAAAVLLYVQLAAHGVSL